VTLTVRNRGSRPHTWTTEAFDTGPIEAGETKTLRVVLPAQGQLRYFCRFHEAQGMQGAFST
jgi:plastocyanin